MSRTAGASDDGQAHQGDELDPDPALLIPMGWCVLRTGWMPRVLGWILGGGGIGYVLSPFIRYLADLPSVAEALALPASVGELWMVGYLLVRGARRHTLNDAPSIGMSAPQPTLAQPGGVTRG